MLTRTPKETVVEQVPECDNGDGAGTPPPVLLENVGDGVLELGVTGVLFADDFGAGDDGFEGVIGGLTGTSYSSVILHKLMNLIMTI